MIAGLRWHGMRATAEDRADPAPRMEFFMQGLDRVLLAATLALCGPIGGCLHGGASTRRPLEPSPVPFEADVPVPVGFELVDASSVAKPGDSTRFLRHRYRGRTDKASVRRFYQAQMPLMRWTCKDDASEGGRTVMHFRRGHESCTVHIGADSANGWRTMVEVTISPIRNNQEP